MAKTLREQQDFEPEEKSERKRVVSAGPCPLVANHGPGRVYKTKGRVRYCVCDHCGATWTKAGPRATEERSE